MSMKELKYREKVSAVMYKLISEDNSEAPLLIRQDTFIQFGSGNKLLAVVFMTNPGSFEFRTPDWTEFKKNAGHLDGFKGEDYADLTMRMIIDAIKAGFGKEPQGRVRIINISNVVQPKGEKAEEYHEKAEYILGKMNVTKIVLQDLSIKDKAEFIKVCSSAPIVIMGFVDKVFMKEVEHLVQWSQMEPVASKLAVAIDDKGRYAHPRRWQTEPFLKQRVIKRIAEIVSNESAVEVI